MTVAIESVTVASIVERARPGGLAAIAKAVARARSSWGPIAEPSPEARTYTCVHRDDDVEVWVLGWATGQATELHDHDGCAGAVHVVNGSVAEERVTGIGAGGVETTAATYVRGQTFSFDGARIHRVGHAGGADALTVHVYSPPIRRMGYYDVAADGGLRRSVIDHTEDELDVLAQPNG